jgi:phospholipid transport system substrate-binding protein
MAEIRGSSQSTPRQWIWRKRAGARGAIAAASAIALLLLAVPALGAARGQEPAAEEAGESEADSPPAQTVEALLDAISTLGTAPEAPERAPTTPGHQEALRTVRATLDLPGIARFALGREWGRLSASQRKQFQDLLTQLIERRALPKAGKFFADVAVSMGAVQPNNSRVRVTTTAESKSEGRVVIEYLLSQGKRGFKVEDVILDRVSLRTNLRSQVQKVIADDSFEELLAKMRRKLAGEEDVEVEKD